MFYPLSIKAFFVLNLLKIVTMKNTFTLIFFYLFMGITQAQRNVVLIIADDLGSDWCGFQENRIDTVNLPNVRKLLSRGVRFSNAWSNPVCSPSRAGMLTGRYSFRTGVGNVIVNPMSTQLDTAEMTIPKLLKNANAPTKYATANVGKWHLQTQNPANLNNPSKMGYDYYAGCFAAEVADYYNWSKVTNGVASTSTTYATVDNTNNAITWMSQQGTKPFFLWLAYNAPHFPIHLPPDSLITNHSLSGTAADIAANQKAYFKVMAEAMDNRIGKVFDWLQANNKLDSTDIIFVGDNGDDKTAAQTPVARIKGTVYQAGVTVPFIIAGPSVKNPGRVSNALVNLQDIFATVVELTGYTNWQTQIAANKPVDSKSLVPILKNTATTARPWAFTEVFGSTAAADAKAIRNQDYKLLNFDSGKQEFYNLTNDPNEATNLLTRTLTATERTNYNYLCTEMGLLLGKTICNPSVDTKDIQAFEKPIIAPNPAKNLVSVTFNDVLSFAYKINSIDGKLIKQGVSTKDINTSDLPNGLYVLKIQQQDAVFTEKIVIEK
jgi:arylsulfatase B